jgi:hypothetical protein
MEKAAISRQRSVMSPRISPELAGDGPRESAAAGSWPRLRRYRSLFFVAPATLAVLAVTVLLLFPAEYQTTETCNGLPCSGGARPAGGFCTTSTQGHAGLGGLALALGVAALISGVAAVIGYIRLGTRVPLPPGLNPSTIPPD